MTASVAWREAGEDARVAGSIPEAFVCMISDIKKNVSRLVIPKLGRQFLRTLGTQTFGDVCGCSQRHAHYLQCLELITYAEYYRKSLTFC